MGKLDRKLRRRAEQGAQSEVRRAALSGEALPINALVHLPIWQGVRRAINPVVRRGDVRTVPVAVAKVGPLADSSVARNLAQGRPVDCKRGCSYCCHVHVDLSIPELMRAVTFAREHFTTEQLQAIQEQARRNAEGARGTTPSTYPVQPCAFLSDDACSIYEARPMACRSEHSFDVGSCRRAYEENDDSPADRDMQTMADVAMMRAALDHGLRDAGFPSGSYELHEVLSIALSDPAAFERWARGEDVFESGRTGGGMLEAVRQPPPPGFLER